jgi:TolB-like protein/Tfp pilus assembly protein PilF
VDADVDPGSLKPATLFLSYSRADEPRARRLASVLQKAGHEVWWDAQIEGGAAYARSISSALERADAVIVLWSASSVESDWVRDEAAQGRDRHRLIPLSLDGSMPPIGFRQYQVIDLSHWHGRSGSREIAAIEHAIQVVIGGAHDASPVRRASVSRRNLLVAGGAAAALIAAGAWIAWDKHLFGGQGAPLSIAVVSFRNLGGDPTQNYFSDGLTEEVRVALTRIRSLHVLAGTSTAKASEGGDDPKKIAQALAVSYVLSGSVERAGDMVRIVANLVDGATGFSRWSQSFDRKLTDIFALQSEIARTVAQAMSIEVATAEPAPGGTKNAEAYEDYLQGKALFNLAKDEPTDRQALDFYDRALAADPNFGLALAARSRSLASLANEYAKGDQLKPLYEQSIAAARRAVEVAPTLAEGQLALGFALYTGKLDVAGARPFYDRAYQLGGGNADVALLYALYCSRAGRPVDATTAVARAVALDPLNARAHRAQGSVAYAARRYSDALPALKRALQLNPKMTYAHALIGSTMLALGRYAEAKQEFAAEPQLQFHFSGLAIAEFKLGNQAAAKQAFSDLVSKVGEAATYQQAEVLAQWGNADEAMRTLQRAREVGDSGLIYAATDPLLDPLRKNPDFVRFVRSLNVQLA